MTEKVHHGKGINVAEVNSTDNIDLHQCPRSPKGAVEKFSRSDVQKSFCTFQFPRVSSRKQVSCTKLKSSKTQ